MKCRKLLGKEVVGARGWKIGRINDLLFDEGSWTIRSIEVQLHRAVAEEYRLRRLLSRSTIEVDVGSVRGIGDHVILGVTKTELRQKLSSATRPSAERPPSRA